MAKFKPGIPDTFTLDVKPVNDLGDYLDERPPTAVARKPKPSPAPRSDAAPVRDQPRLEERVTAPATPLRPIATQQPNPAKPGHIEIPQVEFAREEPTVGERRPQVKAPRREISMAPEVLRLSDELIDLIRRGSGQRDTMPSEVFHALVLLVADVMEELDPHAIPKRGRWGTPTARAYPVELKNAFLRAILEKHGGSDPRRS